MLRRPGTGWGSNNARLSHRNRFRLWGHPVDKFRPCDSSRSATPLERVRVRARAGFAMRPVEIVWARSWYRKRSRNILLREHHFSVAKHEPVCQKAAPETDSPLPLPSGAADGFRSLRSVRLGGPAQLRRERNAKRKSFEAAK
jgi:hypothetical protein